LKFIMDTMVNKRIILHNGNTFLCNNGMPSGHAWTSIINSIVNWIIWTSTVKNCPHIELAVSRDYSLCVQGDDIVLHCNALITEDNVKKIVEWMLINFNYRATFSVKEALKARDETGLKTASFLKRVVNKFGLVDTPVLDIWEKILNGPEYSKCRNSRMTYLRRRMSDLAIFNPKNLEELALYYAYIRHHPEMSSKIEREMYALFLILTNGFTCTLKKRWEIYCYIFRVRPEQIINTKKYYVEYFQQLYAKNFLAYDDSKEYVDYWKERPKSQSVSVILRNSTTLPLSYGKCGFKTLHESWGRKRKPRKR